MIKIYKQGNWCWGLVFDMPEIISLRDNFVLCEPYKVNRTKNFLRTFSVFIEKIAAKNEWSDDELKTEPYFTYLLNAHRRGSANSYSSGLLRKILNKMWEAIALYQDIRDYGIKAPLDIYRIGPERFILRRGNRCLEIMRQLGYENVLCRLFETPELYQRNFDAVVPFGPKKDRK